MNLEALKKLTEEAEGRVNHLYLDTRGNVTVGVGHMLPSLKHAMLLPFEPACDLAFDFHLVSASEVGHPAAHYEHLCKTRLAEADIDAVLYDDTAKFLKELRLVVPYLSYPEFVQEAVFDMAYNLGLAGFAKFQHLKAALDARNWKRCAEVCHRIGISEERNTRTAELFRSA
jgi:GH24 family phage-related lysozyme (muramidase)